ncbi:fatty-acid amide hydrolase-like protein [Sarcoptes scabiei]|uniref:Fatty-acid amide hydrolase-like protein n=1 Tax=Sarcoptes scabiei TaxID=52283 RepID=A0A132ACN8_SARSC|nr:fatty-acid amide hydrolase-like protein [Sarcoptes scabiei]
MSAKSNDLSFKKIFLLLPFQEKIESLLMMLLYFGLRQLRTIMDALTDLLGWIWYWPKRNHLPSITNDLLLQSTSHLLREIRSGNLKCETLVKAYIDRIEKVNPLINALVYNCFDRALEEARDYDRRIENVLSSANVDSQNDQQDRVLELPLLGIPVSVKEISGGSSGGEAALISSAGSLIGIGSDIGGSIRIPTFFCGIFGHKPTSHVVDLHGCFPYCGHQIREKFLVIGPICRYAVDLKPTLKCMIGDDHKTLERLNLDSPVDLKKSKFYFLYEDGDPFKTKVSNEIKNGIKNNFFIWLTNLSDCDAPSLAEELTERKYKLNGYVELLKSILGLSHFRKISCLNVIGESLIYSQERRKSPQFRSLINDGIKLREQLCSLLDDDSILILPCLPERAPKHNGTFLRMTNCGYTAIFNIMELPVTQVNIGLGPKSKMPVGIQVVAKHYNDRYCLAVAELLSKEFGGWHPPCDIQCDDMK